MILVTGARGLIGSAVADCLAQNGRQVRTFDIDDDPRQNIRDPVAMAMALAGIEGIIHLAAVSRVVWAQADPALTWATNVDALTNLLELVCGMSRPPWIVFASSREVYGEPAMLPVAETAPLVPMNVYARSKVVGEALIQRAVNEGLVANVARFSNVYGSILDHHDRVVPAFARAAALGGVVRLEGAEHMFDFTHVSDIAHGLHLLVEATISGERLDPIHFVTGRGTTLRELAAIAVGASGNDLTCEHHAPRSYDVARFIGNPIRAKQALGWAAEIGIVDGFEALTDAFRIAGADATSVPVQEYRVQGRPS